MWWLIEGYLVFIFSPWILEKVGCSHLLIWRWVSEDALYVYFAMPWTIPFTRHILSNRWYIDRLQFLWQLQVVWKSPFFFSSGETVPIFRKVNLVADFYKTSKWWNQLKIPNFTIVSLWWSLSFICQLPGACILVGSGDVNRQSRQIQWEFWDGE